MKDTKKGSWNIKPRIAKYKKADHSIKKTPDDRDSLKTDTKKLIEGRLEAID